MIMATIKETIDPNIIKMFSAHKAEMHEKFQVESLAIFGSVSRGSARPDSDIDILVKYHKTPGIFTLLENKNTKNCLLTRLDITIFLHDFKGFVPEFRPYVIMSPD